MNLACCTKEEAEKALADAKDSVIDAVDHLLEVPPVRGAKFIPPKPTIHDGLTEEVRGKLKQARELFEILNAAPRVSGTEKTQEVSVGPTDEPAVAHVPVLSSGPSTEGNPAGNS